VRKHRKSTNRPSQPCYNTNVFYSQG
jgi:hypothetical protein